MNLVIKIFVGQCLKRNLFNTSFSCFKITSPYLTSSFCSSSSSTSSSLSAVTSSTKKPITSSDDATSTSSEDEKLNQEQIKGLMEFFDTPSNWGENTVKTGKY